jgi:hypothetical protein
MEQKNRGGANLQRRRRERDDGVRVSSRRKK